MRWFSVSSSATRPHFFCSPDTRFHGASSWSVLANMSSIASTYCGHFSRLRQSSSLSFHRLSGSLRAVLEPSPLFVLADLQPELDEDHALVHEAPLEVDDLVVGPHPLFVGGEPLDPLDEQAPVPTPVEHAHPALAGDLAPEPPEEVVAQLALGRLRVGVHRVVPRDRAARRHAAPRHPCRRRRRPRRR